IVPILTYERDVARNSTHEVYNIVAYRENQMNKFHYESIFNALLHNSQCRSSDKNTNISISKIDGKLCGHHLS
ncbi:hypothetical protein L9F63_018729, partial [Diploptera punctata]